MASFHLKFYSQVRNIHSLYTFSCNLKYTNSIGFKVVMRYSIPPTIADHSDKHLRQKNASISTTLPSGLYGK